MAGVARRSGVPTSSPSSSALAYLDASEMDKYKILSNIGKGSFGVIMKVQRLEDGKEFALKQLDYGKMTERDRKQIIAEVAILESLKHRNIVQLVQKIRDPVNERIYILMEYCTSGDLGSVIRKAQRSNTPIHEDRIWNIFVQITLALHHCHWPNERARPTGSRLTGNEAAGRTQVLHRDLKPENVFLSGDFVKLGDFGLSKDMGGHAFTSTYVGTPLYMPPEILAENRYDTKSDIWSLGCLVFEMCALASPFHTAKTQEELISMVRSGKLPSLPAHVSPALKTVIRAMLSLNPVKRPSTKDLLEMDEMKIHRRLFVLQNQATLLAARKQDYQQWEARLGEQAASMQQRETALAEREAALEDRQAQVDGRLAELEVRQQAILAEEERVRENHQRITAATDNIRAQWQQLREQQSHLSSREAQLAMAIPIEPAAADHVQPTRPPLEERKTLPVSSSSRHLRHHAYDDTPSKIPFPSAFASPVPLDSRLAGKISGLPSARGGMPRRLASKSMSNLATRAQTNDEDPSPPVAQNVFTPSKQRSFGAGSPYRHGQRTSIGSPGELEHVVFQEDITMRTASSFASPAPSLPPTPFIPRPRKYSTAALEEAPSEAVSGLPPTLIPAPTFVYRPEATPAKWQAEDPDLPSPFLRRTAPPAQPALTSARATTSSAASERAPLGTINPQQSNSASTNGNPPRKIPRSKSGTLHQAVLRHNIARSSGDSLAQAPAMPTTSSTLNGSGLGPPVRTRPVVTGRDPARC